MNHFLSNASESVRSLVAHRSPTSSTSVRTAHSVNILRKKSSKEAFLRCVRSPFVLSFFVRVRSHEKTLLPRSLRRDMNKKKVKLKIFACTWNVGNENPKSFHPLIPKGGGDADIVAVGLQECTYENHVDSCESSVSKMLKTILDVDESLSPLQMSSSSSNTVEKIKRMSLASNATKTTTLPPSDDDVTNMISEPPPTPPPTVVRGDQLVKLSSTYLGQMKLRVYVRKRHLEFIDEVLSQTEATGIAGVYGNKGGCMISFRIYGTKICIVSAHLAAHRDRKYVKARNRDVQDILRTTLNRPHHLIRSMGSSVKHWRKKKLERVRKDEQDVKTSSRVSTPMLLFDHILWMGDLNYRLDAETLVYRNVMRSIASSNEKSASVLVKRSSSEKDALDSSHLDKIRDAMRDAKEEKWYKKKKKMSDDELHKLMNEWCAVQMRIEKKKWRELLYVDQLKKCMDAGEVFTGWTALEPDFSPTFKVCRGEKCVKHLHQRVSSYCDRILYLSRPHLKGCLRPITFTSVPEMITSDHKPVRATFELMTCAPLSISQKIDARSLRLRISKCRGRNLRAYVPMCSSFDATVMDLVLTHTALVPLITRTGWIETERAIHIFNSSRFQKSPKLSRRRPFTKRSTQIGRMCWTWICTSPTKRICGASRSCVSSWTKI